MPGAADVYNEKSQRSNQKTEVAWSFIHNGYNVNELWIGARGAPLPGNFVSANMTLRMREQTLPEVLLDQMLCWPTCDYLYVVKRSN
jgi:hypothetical protein